MTLLRRGGRGRPIVPQQELWRLERDAKYREALAKDPAAAAWLADFDRELAHGTRWKRPWSRSVHSPDQIRELNAERMNRARNPDVLSCPEYRGPALEEIAAIDDDPDAPDVFLAQHTGGLKPGAEEDALIGRIDAARAVALRHESEDA